METECRMALPLDCHTLHRLEALMVLRQEAGHRALSVEELALQALRLGLNLMLGESLATRKAS